MISKDYPEQKWIELYQTLIQGKVSLLGTSLKAGITEVPVLQPPTNID